MLVDVPFHAHRILFRVQSFFTIEESRAGESKTRWQQRWPKLLNRIAKFFWNVGPRIPEIKCEPIHQHWNACTGSYETSARVRHAQSADRPDYRTCGSVAGRLNKKLRKLRIWWTGAGFKEFVNHAETWETSDDMAREDVAFRYASLKLRPMIIGSSSRWFMLAVLSARQILPPIERSSLTMSNSSEQEINPRCVHSSSPHQWGGSRCAEISELWHFACDR